jgi:hypothetical protein
MLGWAGIRFYNFDQTEKYNRRDSCAKGFILFPGRLKLYRVMCHHFRPTIQGEGPYLGYFLALTTGGGRG